MGKEGSPLQELPTFTALEVFKSQMVPVSHYVGGQFLEKVSVRREDSSIHKGEKSKGKCHPLGHKPGGLKLAWNSSQHSSLLFFLPSAQPKGLGPWERG